MTYVEKDEIVFKAYDDNSSEGVDNLLVLFFILLLKLLFFWLVRVLID